ncbi:MAG: hypothetical protein WBR18_14490 [Anaerolineales bacterium]
MEESSQRNVRPTMVFGVLLVLAGLFLLAVRLIPGAQEWAASFYSWPLILVGLALAMLILGAVGGAPGIAVPAAVLGGLGGLFYWQQATGNWESWAYAWTLMPGFVGVGVILMGLLEGDLSDKLKAGAWLLLISLVMFFIFGSLFGAAPSLGPYWPLLLIGFGVLLLAQSLLGNRR